MEEKYEYTIESADSRNEETALVPRKKSRRHGKLLKCTALLLALALLCGVSGLGGAALYARLNPPAEIPASEDTPSTPVNMSTLTGGELSAEDLYEAVLGSCVGITVSTTVNIFGQTTTSAASGSGFVLTADGYIATNYHVIEEAARSSAAIEVSFADGSRYTATLVGGDEEADAAVIKIDAQGLTPVTLGDSGSLRVAQWVCTVGNPLGELTFSFSDGRISALDRVIATEDGESMNMLQTNCAINPGNSGGPLFDEQGRVVGIVTAKYTNASNNVSAEGLGFAIPIDDVKAMLSDIITYGYVTGKPQLGVTVSTVSSALRRYGIPAGAAVEAVESGSCAEKAGIQVGDVITSFDGKTIASGDELVTAVKTKRAGDSVNVTLTRQGESVTLTVTLDEKTSAAVEAPTEEQEYAFWPFGGNTGRGRSEGEEL